MVVRKTALKLASALLLSGGSSVGFAQAAFSAGQDAWNKKHVPFSFEYGGVPSSKLLKRWTATVEAGPISRFMYTDPETSLQVTAEVRRYPEFPGVVDWVLTFRNNGSSDTPVLQNILPLAAEFSVKGKTAVVHHARGSNARADDFEPLNEQVSAGHDVDLESSGGDSSSGYTLPFFNLQAGSGGVIGAVGWTGNWKADFAFQKKNKMLVTAGMKLTHFVLHPGEEVRTPRIVLMPWTGDRWEDAQNAWRRLLLKHYSPQAKDGPLPGPVVFASWGSEPVAEKLAYVRWLREKAISIDVYGVDAGWYGASLGAENDAANPWWQNRGDWFPSPLYYPNGIEPLRQALQEAGFGFSLWVEPETAMSGTRIVADHPEWFLDTDTPLHAGEKLANLGDPAARTGITAMLSGFISDLGMTWYRQDFNIRPERYWALADAPDRIGIAEIRHMEGLYRMLDDLLQAHPGLRIDNCASGGRRLDLEMMSRSFVVWRSDHGTSDPPVTQAQTQALAPWVPTTLAFGTWMDAMPWSTPGPYNTARNVYGMRLGYSAGFGITPGPRAMNNDAWIAYIRDAIREYREVQPYFYQDFHALAPYSRGDDVWTAWQWDRPEQNDGVILLLRRAQSASDSMSLNLTTLDATALYDIEIRPTFARSPVQQRTGDQLAHMTVRLAEAPASTLILYARHQPAASAKAHGAVAGS